MNSFFKPGDTVGDYVIDSFIGKGAYGEVYKVHDTLGKAFALKLLHDEPGKDSKFREIQGLTALRSSIRIEDGLPLIYYVGKTDRHVYYTMDLADNASRLPGVYQPDTLESRLREQGPLPGLECIGLMRGLLNSLKALHQQGLVHRDIKPGNIIFHDRKPMLADIGLITADPHTMVGTAGFRSPVPDGGPTLESEKAGDLYSLGKVLYCAFSGESVERYPLLPREYSLNDFKAIRPLYLGACSNDPRKRFHSCDEFLNALDQAELKLKTGAAGPGYRNVRRWATVILGAVLIASLAILAYRLLPPRSKKSGAEQILKDYKQAAVRIAFKNGTYHVFCCFSCIPLDDKDPHARRNQFMAAAFLKSALAQELGVPAGKYLKIRHGKYSVQPFKQEDLLIYIYEIAADDCLILPIQP